MASHTYKFDVAMSCGGCSGAIERVLKRLDGVEKFDVSLEKQTAEVVTKDDSLSYDKVLSTIAKTGKKVKAGYEDGESRPIEVPAAA